MGAYSLDMWAMPIDMQAYCFDMRAFNSYMRQLVKTCKIAKPTCEKFFSTYKASTQHMFTTPKYKKTVQGAFSRRQLHVKYGFMECFWDLTPWYVYWHVSVLCAKVWHGSKVMILGWHRENWAIYHPYRFVSPQSKCLQYGHRSWHFPITKATMPRSWHPPKNSCMVASRFEMLALLSLLILFSA